ncbi:uncharacterized protein DNG_06420 [Cephalotrichum gorgonifer]|uniref:5'-3' DNA helicase ZGRF1-like N-terminal domain-containing protein n=1 Tax=Cephalotrichum gorgonifer TaxID=2041049 RepID=A0AAE8SXA1_9PEZI|nr:uncharacterized protein DNG_06420 [Cephalotrichum gorgonifer]
MVSSQSTPARTVAPVIKHICLYTRDLKRKHKRWQDGRLEFHTFNRRVMVYDDVGTHIGDTHRTKDQDVEDGDEFELDRGNVIVQVAERVGQRDQDITEIFARKPKPTATENPPQTPVRLLTPGVRPPSSHFQTQRPLTSLLSTTPGRRIGRAAIPSTSPYEQRQINPIPDEADHRSKRRRLETTLADAQSPTAVVSGTRPEGLHSTAKADI